jgi:acetolactate synthase I/II/III large subunit
MTSASGGEAIVAGLVAHGVDTGFPTALGAKVAHPDRPVVAITGDSGFMFGVQELATAVQFNIGVIILVFNNNAYGNVRHD